jgi:hypothetical protein
MFVHGVDSLSWAEFLDPGRILRYGQEDGETEGEPEGRLKERPRASQETQREEADDRIAV